MRYAVLFALVSLGLVFAAALHKGWWWLALWPAGSAAVVSIGYAGAGSGVLGKTAQGRHASWALLLHAPYMFATSLVWHAERWVLPENPVDRVADGLWVGRRPLRHEIPPGIRWIIDLTGEFWVALGVRSGREYLCRPILDGHICDDSSFIRAVREISALEGELYIHCAQGHGRSAALAAGILIVRGLANNLEDAERLLVTARPRIAMKHSQRRLIQRVTPLLRTPTPAQL